MAARQFFVLGALTLVALTASVNHAGSPRDLAADIGSAKGTVTTASGSPAPGCVIRFMAKPNWSGGPGKKSAGAPVHFAGHDLTLLLQGKGTVIATATTDAQGAFEVKQINAGTYSIIAGNPKSGMAGASVTIEAGKTAQVDIKLQPPTK